MNKELAYLSEWCTKNNVALEQHGECGFARPCVGILKGSNYLEYNPTSFTDYETIKGFEGDYYAPDGVESYHKATCLAVLVENDRYDEGINQLFKWISHLESKGELEVVEFSTGATGIQALVSGVTCHAIRYKDESLRIKNNEQ